MLANKPWLLERYSAYTRKELYVLSLLATELGFSKVTQQRLRAAAHGPPRVRHTTIPPGVKEFIEHVHSLGLFPDLDDFNILNKEN